MCYAKCMAKAFEDKVLEELARLTKGQADLTMTVADLGQDVRRLEVLHESTEEKIDQILEGFSPQIEINATQDSRLDNHDVILDDHDNRIKSLHAKAA